MIRLWTLFLMMAVFVFTPRVYGDSGNSFLYKGKPIHPSCLDALIVDGTGEKKVNLAECSKTKSEVKLNSDGMLVSMGVAEEGMREPFFAYKVLGKFGDLTLLDYQWGGGGTGYFSGIMAVRRQRKWLEKVYDVFGGDRCNGGLSDVVVRDGKVFADVNVTSGELLDLLPSQKALGLTSMELEICAMCCVATATFQVDPATGKGELVGATFGKDLLEERADPKEPITPQDCFNQVCNGFIKAGKLKLNLLELEDFGTQLKEKWAKNSGTK
jgi:hypothetical protein